MKFLFDMGIAQSSAVFLRSMGYDVVHLREQGLHRAEDEAIVRKAQTEERVIVSHDLDFTRIVALSGNSIPSVITFRLDDMHPHCVNRFLTEVISLYAAQIEAGALVSVNERGIRVRVLPLGSQSHPA